MKKWQKPITTRRYLHPPKSEKLHTLWAEGKLVFGDIEAADEREDLYNDYVSAGLWFVRFNIHGELDFHNTENIIRDDGVPVHTIVNNTGGVEYKIEAFSSFERIPNCFFELTLTNLTDHTITDKFGFLLRTANEYKLIKHAPNHYRHYATDIQAWHSLQASWTQDGNILRDGERAIVIDSEHSFTLDENLGFATAEITLAAGESATARFAYTEKGITAFDYCLEKEKCVSLWLCELSKIKNLPNALSEDFESVRMIRHLTATLLQHFAYPKGHDYMIARQGGLHRMIWPYESMPVLEALSRLGDFDDYVEPIIDMYFTKCQSDEGEMVPFGVRWAMCTANVLYSFAKYAVLKDKSYFDKYKDRAYRAFCWMKKTRASTVAEGNIIAGLFPPKRSCDDDLVFQGYGNTDPFNIRGLSAIATAFEHFSDPRASELRAEYEDYLSVLRGVWANIASRSDSDELRVPYIPIGDDSAVAKKFGFGHFGSYIGEAIDIPTTDTERIINYYTRRGFIKGGLYDKMPDKTVAGHVPAFLDERGRCLIWYVTAHEYPWFLYFMRHGMKERAKEIIDDTLRYAMTKEYYMLERYNERDPYFAPWSPNASANGRTLNMLLDYYGG